MGKKIFNTDMEKVDADCNYIIDVLGFQAKKKNKTEIKNTAAAAAIR